MSETIAAIIRRLQWIARLDWLDLLLLLENSGLSRHGLFLRGERLIDLDAVPRRVTWMRHWRQVTYKESAEHVKAIGAENFLLGTDLGQTGNLSQPDGLAMLVAGLMAEGITKDQIKTMGREVPGKLLMG